MPRHPLPLTLAALLFFAVARVFAQGPPGGEPPPQEVSYIVAEERLIPLVFTVIGLVEPSASVEVRARVRGFLQSREFVEGAPVKENEILYKIDPRQFAIAVELAEARVMEAAAEVEQSEAKLKRSRSELGLAKTEYDRSSSLRSTGAVSEGEFDRAEMQFESASAATTDAEADMARASANLRQARTEVESAKLELSYTEVVSPIAGIAGKTLREVGSLVDDNDRGLLTVITRLSPIYVTLSASERDFLNWRTRGATGEIVLRDGQKESIELVLGDGSSHDERGVITYEEPTLDVSTGTYRSRAEFPNTKGLLRPGQFVRARIYGWDRPRSISVPQRAVNQVSSGAYVYVITEGDEVEFRPVKTGEWAGDDWIIESGLKAGERVLVEGFMKVRPGAKVIPVPYKPSAPAAEAATTNAAN